MAMSKEQKILAQREYVKKYTDKFERVNARLEIGTFDRIKALGYESNNQFIVQAVMEKLEREEK